MSICVNASQPLPRFMYKYLPVGRRARPAVQDPRPSTTSTPPAFGHPRQPPPLPWPHLPTPCPTPEQADELDLRSN
eukprot:226009-Chlamydomonas_euryale.AAC.1